MHGNHESCQVSREDPQNSSRGIKTSVKVTRCGLSLLPLCGPLGTATEYAIKLCAAQTGSSQSVQQNQEAFLELLCSLQSCQSLDMGVNATGQLLEEKASSMAGLSPVHVLGIPD